MTAENDTPRKIAAELEKSGPRDGAGRRALQAGQIVELNRRQYPTLLMTSKLRKDTLIFLGASAQADQVEGNSRSSGKRKSSQLVVAGARRCPCCFRVFVSFSERLSGFPPF